MKTVQERLAAIAAEVGLPWEHVKHMTIGRFARMADKEWARQRRRTAGDEATMPGIGGFKS